MSRQKPVWSPDTPPHFATSKSQQQPVIVWCKVHRSRNFKVRHKGESLKVPPSPAPPPLYPLWGVAMDEGKHLRGIPTGLWKVPAHDKMRGFSKGLGKTSLGFQDRLEHYRLLGLFCRLCFSCCLCFLKCIAPGQLFCQWAKCLYSNRHEKYSMKSSRRNNNIFLLHSGHVH